MDCVKVALPQDDYDHAEILDEWLCDWDVSVVFTVCHKKNVHKLYPIMFRYACFYEAYTGYIEPSNDLLCNRSHLTAPEARPFDIVYRATRLPYWFGSHGQLKYEIAEIVAPRAIAAGIRCDISTRPEDTIVGEEWISFLGSGRCTIGTESGSSVIDGRGEVQARIKRLLDATPNLSFPEVDHQMDPGWDDHLITAVSPRHFEAIATKTCQILVEGEYNGIFMPGRHYIALKRDFSNLDEVLEEIKDVNHTAQIAQTAYDEIFLNEKYSYKQFARDIEDAIEKAREQRRQRLATEDISNQVYYLQQQLVAERHRQDYCQVKQQQLFDSILKKQQAQQEFLEKIFSVKFVLRQIADRIRQKLKRIF